MGTATLGALERQLGHWSAGEGALYQKLASGFMRLIREGILQPGARLPSERRLADALTLSRTTVVATYDLLLAAGWIERRAGSGTRVSGTSPVVLAARAAARRRRSWRARSSTCSVTTTMGWSISHSARRCR
jgi:DNA-binding GntR family transcriptional regulator